MDRPSIALRPLLLLLLTLGVIITAMAGWAARSEALTYCVPSTVTGCDQSFGTIQAALNQAATQAGDDSVWIQGGNYSGNFSYNNTNVGNTVQVKGLGATPADTTLTLGTTAGNATGLLLTATSGSTLKNLRVRIPTNADGNGDQGITLSSGVVADDIVVDGPTATNASGIWCYACTVTNSKIDLSTNGDPNNSAIRSVTGGSLVSNSELKAATGFSFSDPNNSSIVRDSSITAHTGATTDGGTLIISNTLIRLSGETGAVGVNLWNFNAGTQPIGGDFDGLTIVNGGQNGPSYSSTGIRAVADNGTESVEATLNNSVISGFTWPDGQTLGLQASNGGTVSFESIYSAYDNGAVSAVGGGGNGLTYTLGAGHIGLENGPGFTDAASGDFTPAAGSDLLDAGDPADPTGGVTDINGNPRACHGKSDGVIRRDIGAFEYRTKVGADLDDCTYPDTSITDGPEAYPPAEYTSDKAQFTLGSSKAGSTYLCSVDGAAFTACASPYTSPSLAEGPHSFAFKAVDAFGNIDQSPAERTVYLGAKKGHPPTCKEDPSLCPKDTTAPKVTNLKVPKKTKLARVKVRFKSNEKGSTFKCRLNKGKWKGCKSPWKTPKLKKGKNTIAIQAIDQAGNKSKVVKRAIKRMARKKSNRG